MNACTLHLALLCFAAPPHPTPHRTQPCTKLCLAATTATRYTFLTRLPTPHGTPFLHTSLPPPLNNAVINKFLTYTLSYTLYYVFENKMPQKMKNKPREPRDFGSTGGFTFYLRI